MYSKLQLIWHVQETGYSGYLDVPVNQKSPYWVAKKHAYFCENLIYENVAVSYILHEVLMINIAEIFAL